MAQQQKKIPQNIQTQLTQMFLSTKTKASEWGQQTAEMLITTILLDRQWTGCSSLNLSSPTLFTLMGLIFVICTKSFDRLDKVRVSNVAWCQNQNHTGGWCDESLFVCHFNITKTHISTDKFKNLTQMITIFSFIPGSNQPPRFLNYFFSTYLLIYEDMPVGESHFFVNLKYKSLKCTKQCHHIIGIGCWD